MRYLSVCSGIEAATVAWHDMGWEAAAFSEIEKFPSQVLHHHYPTVPNVGDMTKYKEWDIGSIGLLVGGTPCQSFSVAGLRKGLDDPRGNLALVYCGILDHFRPKWFVWENVPGVLSSNGGRDFGSFLGALAQLGYGFAYRVLDAQYFGVAQRRRRVFVVGCLGDWRSAAAVLFERQSLRGDTAPSREKGQKITCTPEGIAGTVSRKWSKGTGDPAGDEHYNLMTIYETHPADSRVTNMGETCQTVTSRWGTGGGNVPLVQPISYRKSRRAQSTEDCETWVEDEVTNTINLFDQGDVRATQAIVQPIAWDEDLNARENVMGALIRGGDGGRRDGVAYPITFSSVQSNQGINPDLPVSQTLEAKNPMAVAQPIPIDTMNHIGRGDSHSFGGFEPGAPSYTLTKGHSHAVATQMAVRRLTPVECERLQGFPDNYTNIREKCPDGPRYKALGNSMAVPVMKWIGQRIQAVEEL